MTDQHNAIQTAEKPKARTEFDAWLKRVENAPLYWNQSDAMLAAFVAGHAVALSKLPAPVNDLRPHLEWALRRIGTSLDTGDKYEAAQAALDAAKAAPQASAEYERGHAVGWAAGWDQASKQGNASEAVRNAALEEAAHLMEQTGKRIAASDIRALKQPQADKDARPCSCPSGDGSLRHPCAVHPADHQQHARKIEAAWSECRAEVGTAGWTVSESINYHGFFLHGWRAALSATQPEQGERDE